MGLNTDIQAGQPFMLLPVNEVQKMQAQMAFLIKECERLRIENENLKKPMAKPEVLEYLEISRSHYHTLKNCDSHPLPVRQIGGKDYCLRGDLTDWLKGKSI